METDGVIAVSMNMEGFAILIRADAAIEYKNDG